METKEHIYTSNAENFLSWHDWAMTKLSEEELDIYMVEELTPEKLELYSRWIVEEQITSRTYLEDGVEIFTETF
jgi:hypothetical protein